MGAPASTTRGADREGAGEESGAASWREHAVRASAARSPNEVRIICGRSDTLRVTSAGWSRLEQHLSRRFTAFEGAMRVGRACKRELAIHAQAE